MFYKSLERIETVRRFPEANLIGYLFHCRNMMSGGLNVVAVMAAQLGDRDPQTDAERWRSGELIQDAFPYLSPEQREQLLTGFSPGDWARLEHPELEHPDA